MSIHYQYSPRIHPDPKQNMDVRFANDGILMDTVTILSGCPVRSRIAVGWVVQPGPPGMVQTENLPPPGIKGALGAETRSGR